VTTSVTGVTVSCVDLARIRRSAVRAHSPCRVRSREPARPTAYRTTECGPMRRWEEKPVAAAPVRVCSDLGKNPTRSPFLRQGELSSRIEKE